MPNGKMLWLLVSCFLFVAVTGDALTEKLHKAYCSHENIEQLMDCIKEEIEEELLEEDRKCLESINDQLHVDDSVGRRDFFCSVASDEEVESYKRCLHAAVEDPVIKLKYIQKLQRCAEKTN
ncbi:uncharacterized protein [Centruroides vittatus]|uniref:uncharacterized protein n=1 Tax=Centruroides vittatus TaxID=120091 RepID=UPI00350F1009